MLPPTDSVLDLVPVPDPDQLSNALEVRTGEVRYLLENLQKLIAAGETAPNALLPVLRDAEQQVFRLESDIDDALTFITTQRDVITVLKDQRDEALQERDGARAEAEESFSGGYSAGYSAMWGEGDIYDASQVDEAREEGKAEGYLEGRTDALADAEKALQTAKDTLATYDTIRAEFEAFWNLLTPEEQAVLQERAEQQRGDAAAD